MHATTSAGLRVLEGVVRRTWIAGALCVLVCATFLGRAAGHAIETQLGESSPGLPLHRADALPPPPVPDARDGVAPAAFSDRNMFCSDCTGSVPGDPPPPLSTSQLPLVLLATSLASPPDQSTATIRNTASGGEGAFRVGQRVPGAGALEKVAGTYVWIKNEATGATERVELLAVAAAEPPQEPSRPSTSTKPPQPWAGKISQIDDHTWEVDRELIRGLVSAQHQAGQQSGARLIPATKDGKLYGVRVASVKKDSMGAAIGLKSGDVIESVDGKALDSPDALLGMYADLDRLSSVQLGVSRRGKVEKLDYRLR